MITCTFPNGSQNSLRHGTTQVICEKDNAILLVKRAVHLLGGNLWSLPAGYMDRDETAAECALRELKEETGWEGKIKSLFRINTNPFRRGEDTQNIAFEFLVEPVKKVTHTDDESSKIEWVPISQLFPPEEFAFDHGESIYTYLQYRKEKFALPLFV